MKFKHIYRNFIIPNINLKVKRIISRIKRRHIVQLWVWNVKGRPIPPPHVVKLKTVKKYAKNFSIRILVETGTFRGAMINATKNCFERIFSIELNKSLYERANRLFSNYDHISIIHGDSGEVLPNILTHITQPSIFWLDAHYSKGITSKGALETPIIQELNHIFDHYIKDHVILIDDADSFIGENDYPTIDKLRNLIAKEYPDGIFEVKFDIIRIHKNPKKAL